MFFRVPVILCLVGAYSLNYAVATKCITPTHYKEIGCTPITKANESCPSSFNCDHLKNIPDHKCHFRGKELEDHQSPDALPACVPYAFCVNGLFQAGHIDCGQTYRLPEEVCEDIRVGCCPHTVCGEELKKLHVCQAEGKAHYDGETWNPKEDKCMTCKCDDKWNNATDIYKNPNCQPYECFDDFWHIKEYKKGCAPVYYGSDRCCPSETKCPSAEDKLIKAKVASPHTELKCKFGDLELQLGDGVNDKNNCLDCKCLTPPLMECNFIDGCEQVFN